MNGACKCLRKTKLSIYLNLIVLHSFEKMGQSFSKACCTPGSIIPPQASEFQLVETEMRKPEDITWLFTIQSSIDRLDCLEVAMLHRLFSSQCGKDNSLIERNNTVPSGIQDQHAPLNLSLSQFLNLYPSIEAGECGGRREVPELAEVLVGFFSVLKHDPVEESLDFRDFCFGISICLKGTVQLNRRDVPHMPHHNRAHLS